MLTPSEFVSWPPASLGRQQWLCHIPAASYGVSSAARAIEPTLKAGDRIVVVEGEFPSNVLPWRRVARETGAVVVTVPTPGDGDWTTAALVALARGARVAALGNCHWTNGARLDLVTIAEACRAVGAALVLDNTQSWGAMPLDLNSVQPDFVVASGYKWLLCPYGFSLMYVGPAWRDARPLEETWLARTKAEDFTSLVNYSDTYMPGARRFDAERSVRPFSRGRSRRWSSCRRGAWLRLPKVWRRESENSDAARGTRLRTSAGGAALSAPVWRAFAQRLLGRSDRDAPGEQRVREPAGLVDSVRAAPARDGR